MSDSFKPLFNQNLLKARVESFMPELTEEQLKVVRDWANAVSDPKFRREKERSHQGTFLMQIFGILLGYGLYNASPHDYNLRAATASSETKGGKTPDGTLGFFGTDKDLTRVVIELKSPAVNLDAKQAGHGGMTPVEQGFSYVSKFDSCKWVIVSNFTTLRLYSSARGEAYFQQWDIADLKDACTLREFLYCLQKDHLISESQLSIIGELAERTHAQEEQITREFYGFYNGIRSSLFDELVKANRPSPESPKPENDIRLLEKAQKILDRVLFICFSESRGLLPPGLIRRAFASARSGFVKTTRWQQLVGLFDAIDKGDLDEKINGYNGGLFQHDSELAALKISDQYLDNFLRLSEYDFLTDLNVNILGHIFEQSITDLETLRSEIRGEKTDKRKSKRKREGIFYTRDLITRFIVESTIGSWLSEKYSAIHENYSLDKIRGAKKKIEAERRMWEDYREVLRTIKVVDPACGSGAFLVAAFDYLYAEYARVNDRIAELSQGQWNILDLDKQIIQENLFGVDINSESVEITKLSLWLKTAKKNKPLDNLDANIRCGNSIVPLAHSRWNDEIRAAYDRLPSDIRDRSFDWETDFPQVLAQGGFDCVIGNPPYIRQELLSSYKPYLRTTYKCFSSSADLYIYFFEQGLSLLKQGGRLGYITSGTFARTSFAATFREWLPQVGRFEKVVNFGENQPFEDAEMVCPTISILVKDTKSRPFQSLFMRGSIPSSIGSALEADGVICDDQVYGEPGWRFQSSDINDLSEKIFAKGHNLKEVATLQMHYGIKTGLNEAFIVDQRTKDRLVQGNQNCAAVLKRLLGGEDLRPWYFEDKGRWLIFLPAGMTAQKSGSKEESTGWSWLERTLPPIAEHLAGFQDRGRHRSDQGQFWWELRPCDYYEAFEKSKVLWPDIAKLPRFSWDTAGCVLNNTGYIMTAESPWILSVLQSRLMWFCISQISTPLRLRGGLWQYRCIKQFIERLPIITPSDDMKQRLATLAMGATSLAVKRYGLHESVRHRIKTDLADGKTALNQKLEKWWETAFPEFRRQVETTLRKDIPLKERAGWEAALTEWQTNHDQLTSELVGFEEEINGLVYRLYGLSDSDVQLLEDHSAKDMILYPYGAP